MRKLALLVLGIGILLCCSALAFAADKPTPAAPAAVTLTVDPFVNPDIATRVPMVPRCPCDVYQNCIGYPIGYDCASPSGCCTCQGVNPAYRQCVGVPS